MTLKSMGTYLTKIEMSKTESETRDSGKVRTNL